MHISSADVACRIVGSRIQRLSPNRAVAADACLKVGVDYGTVTCLVCMLLLSMAVVWHMACVTVADDCRSWNVRVLECCEPRHVLWRDICISCSWPCRTSALCGLQQLW
jgi:hypothetical protein